MNNRKFEKVLKKMVKSLPKEKVEKPSKEDLLWDKIIEDFNKDMWTWY